MPRLAPGEGQARSSLLLETPHRQRNKISIDSKIEPGCIPIQWTRTEVFDCAVVKESGEDLNVARLNDIAFEISVFYQRQ